MNWWGLKRADGLYYAGVTDGNVVFGEHPARFTLVSDAHRRQRELAAQGHETTVEPTPLAQRPVPRETVRGKLTEKQLQAVLILHGHRIMKTTEKSTSKRAINRTTAWGLESHGLAECWYSVPQGEVVKLRPHARQLINLGKATR